MQEVNGLIINRGIALGSIVTKLRDYKIEKKIVDNENLEFKKLEQSLNKAIKKLKSMENSKEYPFMDAHLLILKDEFVKTEIKNFLIDEKCNIEYAFSKVMDKYINKLKASTDEYLRERYLDLCDIKNQILEYLMPKKEQKKIIKDSILIVEELYPSDVITLDKHIKGIISFRGGITSHSAILCRSYDIPYVQINKINIDDFSKVLIKGRKVTFDPSFDIVLEEEKEQYFIDDTNNIIWANVNFNHEIKEVLNLNFYGIGLYRSEYLMLEKNRFLTLKEQYLVYLEVLKKLYPKPVIIRTFDLGNDKSISGYGFKVGPENYETYPQMFEDQIRALVKVNMGNLKIMFPNIKTISEFDKLRKIVNDIKQEEKNEEILEIGMMIETREAIETIQHFASPDFFSIGTNDLMLNLYKIKREEKSKITEIVLNDLRYLLKKAVCFCKKEKKEISVCGEFASTKRGKELFIESGVVNFSVGINNVNEIIKRKKNKTL